MTTNGPRDLGRRLLCPSAKFAEGGLVIGALMGGRVVYRPDPLRLTPVRLKVLGQGDGDPATWLRVAAPCVREACVQWQGSCGVAAEATEAVRADAAPTSDLAGTQPCSIRAVCRWYAERGRDACTACEWIATREPDDAK